MTKLWVAIVPFDAIMEWQGTILCYGISSFSSPQILFYPLGREKKSTINESKALQSEEHPLPSQGFFLCENPLKRYLKDNRTPLDKEIMERKERRKPLPLSILSKEKDIPKRPEAIRDVRIYC